MAENYTPNPVTTFVNDTTAVNTVNGNFTAISTAFQDVLSRSGVSPNQMLSTLDMNNNQMINLPPPSTTNSPIRVADIQGGSSIVIPPTGTSGHVVPFLDGNNTWSGNNSFNNLTVTGGLTISSFNNATFTGTGTFNSINTFSTTNTFNGAAIFNSTVTLSGGISSTTFTNCTYAGTNSLTGTSTFSGTSTFNNNATFNNPVGFNSSVSFSGGITGTTLTTTTLAGSTSITGPSTFSNTATFNSSATFNNLVSIAAPTGITPGLSFTQTLNGAFSSGNLGAINITVNDTATITGSTNQGSAMLINYNFGGTNIQAAREGINITANLNANSNGANPKPFYVGIKASAISSVNDNNNANLFAFNGVVATSASLGTIAGVVGQENDLLIPTGTNPVLKFGYTAISVAGDVQQGTTYDAGYAVLTQTGGVGWQHGYLIAKQGGLGGVTSSGTCFGTQDSFSVANGVDISSVTISGAAFKSPGFSVTGVGQVLTGAVGGTVGSISFIGNTSGTAVIGVTSTGQLGLTSTAGQGMNLADGANGFMMVLDSIGASIANQIAIVPAASGNSPAVAAAGTDSNILITVQGKGNRGVSIVGTQDGSNAPARSVGEYVSSGQVTTGNLTSASETNITSITLTAGDWEVFGIYGANPAGSTVVTLMQGTISLASASGTPAETGTGFHSQVLTYSAGFAATWSLCPARISVSSTTTVYLNTLIAFTTSTCTATGLLKARRIR